MLWQAQRDSMSESFVTLVNDSFATSVDPTSEEESFALSPPQEGGGHRSRAVLTSLDLEEEDLTNEDIGCGVFAPPAR